MKTIQFYTLVNTQVMFLAHICFKSTLKQDLFMSNFSAFPEIQDVGQKEIIRDKFKFRFSK